MQPKDCTDPFEPFVLLLRTAVVHYLRMLDLMRINCVKLEVHTTVQGPRLYTVPVRSLLRADT